MKVIWEHAPITSTEIVKRLKQVTEWKDNTIYTLITRLANKKMISIDKSSSPNLCYPLMSQEDGMKRERHFFLEKVYNGSLNLMLANIIEEENLTEKEIQELKSILDEKDHRGKKE